MRLFIIANRLPVKIFRDKNGEIQFMNSEGGLATGLDSINSDLEKHWIGWPGMSVDSKREEASVTHKLEAQNYHPVFLTAKQINYYYEGYSNSTLWPLFHYFYSFIEFDSRYWNSYKEVNGIFAEKALKFIQPGDIVWVQDYQLMLVPQLLREKMPEICIGYFHHVPFPSYEFFRVLPERAELLNGLLGADLIGFHTHDYMRHFISTVERVLHHKFHLDRINVGRREVYVNTFPMGINYKKYHDAPTMDTVKGNYRNLCRNYGDRKLILSVDRLDYSKGIIHRIRGFAGFLKDHPEYHEKVSMIMITVPSRDKVLRYAKLKKKIDETISYINGIYSTINWIPIYYFYQSLEFKELVALYHRADIALVTPLRDGMNLVSKEYVAAKRNLPGVLILSEMAGSAIELREAIIINPNDIRQIEQSIVEALKMPREEQLRRMHEMQKVVEKNNVKKWASNIVGELIQIHGRNKKNNEKAVTPAITYRIRKKYRKAVRRLILLDYDGTLSPFYNHPEDAYPRPELLDLLSRLKEDGKNELLLNSGRDRKNLEEWFGPLAIDMEAEHGAAYKREGIWHERVIKTTWSKELLHFLNTFVDITPGAYLEKKETALVWHYRNVDDWLASLREQQLINALIAPCSRYGLQIMRGNKIVEIKSSRYSKSSCIGDLLDKGNYDFILCMGDDVTDEDMFRTLPSSAYTIKIGEISDTARYDIFQQEDVLPFLKGIMA
ncbi:MAG: bifunctional alpha,alpha-trehalose-phosphate synthase (UDP-forming)/trehalose-phosphatase [Bacteroidales bacterium]|jgi:trehalose 6-phosphate synthase/phosphatase|nr:bifunctional alpha,alpha-trehalose-phosphate synthase (UDP-forming)/trehalose-phosphatase [Bacteroidales bacterium]MCI2122416.1 bifunctional alpha,alpha-trehalose-phosphate synthase (UDP-forming)/trehalose-phosphatase [Bacteroidales bacterium]MCI2144780.1 bifunctional alpha,alpha-trehalose-phosphate synthase (UDP-forming)/trehalose-phosphatase [Bacteroidales bacterium]